jgi:membrane-associated phospholipid phosphatase
MKGISLASYLMIANLTAAATIAFSRPAFAQEGESSSNASRPADSAAATPASEINQPDPKTQSGEASKCRLTLDGAGARLFHDQKEIWTSPTKLRPDDTQWLLPLAGVTTGFILTDSNFSASLSNNQGTLNTYKNIRTGSIAALGAASGGLFLWSLRTHDLHQRETGILAGEAVFNALVLTEGLKYATGRERPTQDNGQGNFFQGGTSFPSNHSAAAWAAAGILAHEYPGVMTKFFAYGLASTVSFASVGSKEHFPSDVLIGSALGWMVAEYTYRQHHNAELGGSAWNPLGEILGGTESGPTRYPGSTYVPLDSWVYPAFDRLAALGFVSDGFAGKRPWSREQCVSLLLDADEAFANYSGGNSPIPPQVNALLKDLHHEFARDVAALSGPNTSLEVDSIYTRILSASGAILDDGYHFGQTYAYDFGRPFRRGTNFISGGSASATYGNLFFYFSGEFQHSPAAPALSAPVRDFIAQSDKVAVPPDTPFAAINQFRFLDAYAGVNVHGWQLTFGNQSLSWGPGSGGSLLLSDNAAPFPMVRLSPENSFEVPGLSKILGPFSVDQFVGRLDGHPGVSEPWLYGQKISFKPLHSLEFAYSRTTIIGGSAHPLTANTFFRSLFGRVDPARNSVPGDSRTAIDWTWRLPGMHNWATFYGELEDDDDLIPLQNLSKSVLRPGIYLPRLPFLPRWDLHFEWTTSTSPGRASFQNHGNLNYWNLDYPDGYTNDGDLMGNTVGREGITLQAWTRYWISPRNTLDFSWKQSRVLSDFVPGGGKWQDFQFAYSITTRSGAYIKSFLQFEHISSYPLLFAGSKNNVTAGIEIGFLPQWGHKTLAFGLFPGPQADRIAGGPTQ